MRRIAFADVPNARGALVLNRVFERYLVPFCFTSEQLCLHVTYNDIDTALSPIWLDDSGNAIAAALLAVRGKRAWIGGFGVAPDNRGQGHGRALADSMLAAARARNVESVTLEVLCENTSAIALYERTGFSIARTLHSLETTVTGAGPPSGIDVVDPVTFIEERMRQFRAGNGRPRAFETARHRPRLPLRTAKHMPCFGRTQHGRR